MNCEMAQRTIALAALAPSVSGPGQPNSAPRSQQYAGHAPDFEAEFFAEHPELLAAFPATELESEPARAGALEVDLPLDERRALEAHLAGCRECQAEMAATAAFYRALSLAGQAEPTPSLLARARLRLDAKLDENAHCSLPARLLQQLSFSAGRLRAAPGLASGLLLVGLVAGGYGGYRAGHAAHNQEQQQAILNQTPGPIPDMPADRGLDVAAPLQVFPGAEPAGGAPRLIADISSIVREPGSERVEVRYDRLVPDAIEGTLDDPSIRRLLMLGLQPGASPLVRYNSLILLSAECRLRHGCGGGPVRSALLAALRSNRDPQVRIEALNGLEPYIAEDMQVRDAVLRSVMADTDPDVRIEAIRLLTPVEVDSSVRHALHTVASQDGNPSIRNASQQVLNGMPQVQ